MKIEITKEVKIKMLQALQKGYLETADIPELQKLIDDHAPARILTKKEAKEYLDELNQDY